MSTGRVGPCAPSPSFWKDKRVMITGHTGFVGGWLCLWLAKLGARITGLALQPNTTPSLFARAEIADVVDSRIGDVRNVDVVRRSVASCDPEVVIHLAAQPIVRLAYRDPVESFATNVMGTVNVLEACRSAARLRALVVFTTDKVYRNEEWPWPYRETDRLGGDAPYSASKACAELVSDAYRASYFSRAPSAPALLTVRAGNIVGGGDWASDRLIPDAVRAFSRGIQLTIRNPGAVRPWQHVLDALRGLLVLIERSSDAPMHPAWNFGPDESECVTVEKVARLLSTRWGGGVRYVVEPDSGIPESQLLMVSSRRAKADLGWRCSWNWSEAVSRAVDWYLAEQRQPGSMRELSLRQIEDHLQALEPDA